ncbi:MAG: DeoR/GlpR transcriptional regulator [Ruminococcaceae bacterium]|nr:DeoR/GlpR transcriptional regulator [Oscillospiraceae bacterium]
MLAQERSDLICRVLMDKRTIKVSEVMQLCGVSHETARRDLETLQEEGIVKRVHGGAVLIQQDELSALAPVAPHQTHSGNISVAKEASRLIRPGSTVYIAPGRTMAHLAHFVKDVADLSVVTPSLLVINELSGSGVNVFALGGNLWHDEGYFGGKQTSADMAIYNVDIAFISCGGLDLATGTLMDYDDNNFSHSLLRSHSNKLVLLLNSEKLHIRTFSNVGNINIVDCVIVDSRITPEDADALRAIAKKVIIASVVEDAAVLNEI